MLVSSWQTPSFLLLTSSLAYNILSPTMNIILTPLVSSLGGEVNPTLDSDPLIGYPPFNISHFIIHLISLWHKIFHILPYSSIPLKPSHWHQYLCQSCPCLTSWFFWVTSRVFLQNNFKFLTVHTHQKHMSQIFLYKTSWGHWNVPLSLAIPFEPYSLWPGFTRSLLPPFICPFSTCWVQWGAWFPIMVMYPPYPNFTTDNIFNST